MTCKAKRLKCDETKPQCGQCTRRKLQCGGYKKDFKWRAFEETSLATKSPAKRPRKGQHCIWESFMAGANINDPASVNTGAAPEPLETQTVLQWPGSSTEIHGVPPENARPPDTWTANILTSTADIYGPEGSRLPSVGAPSARSFSPLLQPPSYAYSYPPIPPQSDGTVTTVAGSVSSDASPPSPISSKTSRVSGQSPRLVDLLLPGTDLYARTRRPPVPQAPPRDLARPESPERSVGMVQSRRNTNVKEEDDDVDEVVPRPELIQSTWPTSSLPTSSSPQVSSLGYTAQGVPLSTMYRQPELAANSPEMLMVRFDSQTCGILSIKDGPTENPWRTLVWPLARESPALFHALAAMTAFHTCRQRPALRIEGVEHMRRSVRSLAAGIESMRSETALATTLALAFAESWDQHISTGIKHLRGARVLLDQALVKHGRGSTTANDFARLNFLANAWLYMDVLARLTSSEDEGSNDFDRVLPFLHGPLAHTADLDPLLGGARTLFPLIGRAANLVRRVRATKVNSPEIISEALKLKWQIEHWRSDGLFVAPEDPSIEIQHSIETAEAYRWATVLYLHQAVPELPSMTTAQLAKRVLMRLAAVPSSSRTVIVHIYPLLVAGSEAVDQSDRQWVEERWACMTSRMWIGNVDRCREVVQEVWRRRRIWDARQAAVAASYNHNHIHAVTQPQSTAPVHASGIPISSNVLARKRQLDQASEGPEASYARKRMAFDDEPRLSPAQIHLGLPAAYEAITQSVEAIPFERTVRGSVHWAGVMRDWRWEVLLG